MSVRIEQLTHTYQSAGLKPRTVLQAIESWHIEPGQHVLLQGVSGSGKTTLLNILTGLLPPTQGQVWFGEQAIYTLAEAVRDRFRSFKVGYIFQAHHLLPTLSALENVVMPMVFAENGTRPAQKQQAMLLLTELGLADFAHHRPVQLSSGQRLRVAIARALANQPALLLADEPTAALDEAAAREAIALLQESCRRQQAILIVASHDVSLAPQFDRVFDLRAGQLREVGR